MNSLLNRLLNTHKEYHRWLAGFLCLAMLVSIGTVAAVSHTGIAMTYTERLLECPYAEEGAEPVAHVHNDDCLDEDGNLICTLPEIQPHEHTEDCYKEQSTLICGLEESDGHVHTDDCREQETVYVCGLEESDGHEHTEDCWTEKTEQICGLGENPGHLHDEDCYEEQPILICENKDEDHKHTADCYLQKRVLICENTDEKHEHTDACYGMEFETEEVPVCGLEEGDGAHYHTEDCFETTEVLGCGLEEGDGAHHHTEECEEVRDRLICGLEEGDGAHHHTEDCYETESVLVCGQEELPVHVHGEECIRVVERTIEDPAGEGDGEEEEILTEAEETTETENDTSEEENPGVKASGGVEGNTEEETGEEAETLSPIVSEIPEEEKDGLTDPETPEAGEAEAAENKDEDGTEEPEKNLIFTGEAGGVHVMVAADPEAFPEGTTMQVEAVTQPDVETSISDAVRAQILEIQAVDITFTAPDGTEVEPAMPIRVTMTAAEGEHAEETAQVVHVDHEGNAEVVEQAEDAEPEALEVIFDADAFTIYAIVYTVDFEYEVDGQIYTASVAGATDILLSELVKELHVVAETETAEFLSKISEVSVSNPEVLSLTEEDGDWTVRVLKDSEEAETLNIMMQDGAAFRITAEASGTTEVSTANETAVISTVNDLYLPEAASAYARELDEEESSAAIAAVEETLGAEEGTDGKTVYQVFDIGLNDVEYTDYEEGFLVDLKLPEGIEGRDYRVFHILHDGQVQELNLKEEEPEAEAEETATANEEAAEDGGEQAPTVSFVTDSFSEFVIRYTVDFHNTVNGKTYDFSIPGGGFVSFEQLAEVLGLAADSAAAEEEPADAEAVPASETAEEDADTDDTAVTLSLSDVVVSEETRQFVAEVESLAFSSPELVWVGKAEAETTVGTLKTVNGLECEYSEELTEEQIEEINAQTVETGDWALISMQPFLSEESLTVTMKNGDQFFVRVTDAQISAYVITTKGEHFRITIKYDEDAKIPDGSKLVAREILEGTEEYEKYLVEAAEEWEETDREGFISYARFFDLEIQKDGKKVEPEAPVEVKIDHEDGFTLFNDESLSVIHFAEDGTEIIDELHRNIDGTEIVYEQTGFSVIGTVSTVKESGWPTANGQYVLVLQDGDDYYALKQDGTLTKIRYFNNTVSFIGEGTTTTDYINDYLWYVQSNAGAAATGRISDKYYENGSSVEDQMFIVPTQDGWLMNAARQIRFNPTERKLYYTYYNVSRTLSAHDGQLSVVNLDDSTGSRMFFATASSFTANDNETDLFTQIEVESIIDKWREQKIQEATYDKTAEVYDYENRIYRVDVTASSSDYEVAPSIALEFVVDASRSMFFPTSVNEVGTFNGTNASNVRDWINAHGDTNQVYFVIQDKNGKATQYAIFYDPNSEYQGGRGQWLWVDASVYNPPDDVSNGGNQNSMQAGLPLSSWNYDSMDDGKIYTTGITGTSNGTYGERKTWISRIEYLKQCVRVASQVIYAVDENAQIGLIGFNKATTDYGTFGKDEQETLLEKLDNISLDGGTNHQGGLQKAIDKYQNPSFYAEHYAGRKHVVVLVTDGAPNAAGVTWTTIGNVATTLKNLRDDFGNYTELYTMGLSLTNVGSNQGNLFGVSSGAGYTYAGEDAAQIINAVTKMVDGIFVQANLVADVTDVIDPAFYPVNKADGRPLAEDDWINLNGTKVNAGASDAAGQIKKDATTGNWYVEWKNQSIDWPTTDSHGGITEPGWHGTVFVKAKEDFLGGNGISTNAEGSKLEATKFIVRGETEQHDLPDGDHTTTFETPYVNIDELDITKNDTEWTVYLGTDVDPLTEVKALWEKVKVREVVTKTDSDHRVSSDGSLTYQYAANTNDNRAETNGREEFPPSELGITLTDDDWTDLIAGQPKTFTYSAYDHSSVGTIRISLTQGVKTGEKNLSESPHDTAVAGDEVEKYTLTVSYRPAGANIANWHTGSYGSGMSGSRAGNISKDNTHIINVFVKGLQITKVDLSDRVLPGAKFALYRSARTGEADLLEIGGGQYYKVADLDTSSTGIAVKEQIEQLEEGEQYYLVETQTPAGYNAISPIPVTLSISDVYTPKPGTATQTTKPDSGIYDWIQNASLVLNAESGVKQTNADNTEDLTHSATVANSNSEIIYYRITNNPGVILPNTGGPGTMTRYLLGIMLTVFAGTGLVMKKRRNAA